MSKSDPIPSHIEHEARGALCRRLGGSRYGCAPDVTDTSIILVSGYRLSVYRSRAGLQAGVTHTEPTSIPATLGSMASVGTALGNVFRSTGFPVAPVSPRTAAPNDIWPLINSLFFAVWLADANGVTTEGRTDPGGTMPSLPAWCCASAHG